MVEGPFGDISGICKPQSLGLRVLQALTGFRLRAYKIVVELRVWDLRV